MSMILDALTRAEHERQLEKQPDLKFVTPVKPQKKGPNNLWLWIGLGVLVNALILFFIVRALSGGAEDKVEMAAVDSNTVESEFVETPINSQQNATATQGVIQNTQIQQPKPLTQEAAPLTNQVTNKMISSENPSQNQYETPAIQNAMPADATPLAMEMNNAEIAEVDRPLLYESKQPSTKPKASKPKPTLQTANADLVTAKNKGKVSFSSTELSADDALPVIDKPKLLIDQGYDENTAARASVTGVPNVRDLPESSRSNLNQYEINVHVFDDDDAARSFVLINMDKYKEGDRIANNGPLVQQITPEGVVIDYGSGRALLPAK